MSKKRMTFDKRLLSWSRKLLDYRLSRQGFVPLEYPKGVPNALRKMRSGLALHHLLGLDEFETVLDVGSGDGAYAEKLEAQGKTVTRFDFGKSRAFDAESQSERTIIGDFLDFEFTQSYDCIWAAHVLEHTPDPQSFLKKMRFVCKEDGWLVITVPPAKGQLVGGHLSLWTPGLLLYHLVLAGVDCSEAVVLRYGYSISVIVRNRSHKIDMDSLAWDLNDIEKLSGAFPPDVKVRCNGDIVGKVYRGAEINFVR